MESGAAVKHISRAGNAENHEDQDLWKGQQGRLHMGRNKTGSYTVKSGYWVQTNVLNKLTSVEEDQPSLDRLYQLAWGTDMSPKIHHFLWRCISNSLPVAGNMARKHISKEAGCLRCGNEDEIVNHVLFQCPFSRLLWAISPIPAPSKGIQN